MYPLLTCSVFLPSYVPLSDNEKTDFRARELKSVYMDAVGQYLKLIFHKNYANKYNLYGQVSLESLPGNLDDTSLVKSRHRNLLP